jgi:hypothetical protein
MDYGKTGAAKAAKGAPKYDPHRQTTKGKGAQDDKGSKAALLARMKAAAEKRDTDGPTAA